MGLAHLFDIASVNLSPASQARHNGVLSLS